MKKPNALWLYKHGLKLFIGIMIAIALIGTLASCGARKVNKSKEEIKTTAETEIAISDNTKTEIKTDTNTKVIDCTSTDEIEIRPVDEKEIMIVNGKTYKNAVLKHKKVKNNIVTDSSKNVAETKQNDIKTVAKSKVDTESKKESKESDRKQFNWVPIIITFSIIILLIIMFVLWYYFGIGKKKNNTV